MHRKIALLTLVLFVIPHFASADISSDVQIKQDGTVIANNVLVMQKSERTGSNIFVRATWGQAFVRMTLIVNAKTEITKEHGEVSSVSDIQVGDRLDVEGQLTSGADTILFTPTKIRDHALQTAAKTFSGSVSSVDTASQAIVLKNGKTATTIFTSGATITKGVRTVAFSDLTKGDKILSAVGTYDYASNTLTATSIAVYQDPAVFKPRNFDGTIASISGTTLPTTITLTSGGATYTVFLSATSSILSASRKAANLTRVLAGDRVRIYGAIRPTDLSQVDADIMRDLTF